MKIKGLILFFILCFGLTLKATHNRAGEILYTRIAPTETVVGGVTVPVYHYSITVVVYTDHGQSVADRCADTVYFGDGLRGIAYRINGGTSLNCGCGSVPCGELLINEPNYKVKKNIYTITHYYAGAGTYTIQMYDPNRNAGVYNIPNSDQQPFYLESVLIINNATGANTSPLFNCDPIDRACLGKCFYHNPCCYDIDHDSLSYEITTSRGWGGSTVPGYTYPDPGQGGYYGINAVTGLLTWCVPQVNSEFNVAFIVKEWRKNSSGYYELIGSVLRDMQVVVKACPENNPPLITLPQDTCVEAGTFINKKIYVSDPENQFIKLIGYGGAFECVAPNANLNPSFALAPYYANFTWQTTCNHISQQPYQTIFKASDDGNPNLVFFATYSIKVVPPAVKNVTAVPVGSSIKVSWSLSACSTGNNPLKAYKIYRRDSCVSLTFVPCQTGVPPNSGFVYIGETDASTAFFIDNNGTIGLVVGKSYSYLVVASYQDGTQTFASAQVCTKLKRDIPIIIKADVLSTSTSSGSIHIAWERPATDANNLDTLLHPGPYQFILKYKAGSSGTFALVYTSSSPYFLGLSTSYTQAGMNTVSGPADYQVEFTSGTLSIGSSPLATSIFLQTTPSDRSIQLNWASQTPWNNYKYKIWKKDPGSPVFVLIDSTTQTQYLDENNIVNKYSYCYKITSQGEYSDPGIFHPIINNSQESCATAIDLTAPCTPTLSVEADCPTGFVKISWNNVTSLPCGDDVVEYILFYKKTIDGPYSIIYQGQNLSYTYDGLEFISGCYSIQAKDSASNYSPLSPDFCLENCPLFELPNVVSPNNDGANDFYKAVKVRQIKEININIYDRWGNLIYNSTDPYFQWNVYSKISNQPVSEGTLFYTCDVYEVRLKGTVMRTLTGWIQVVR